MPPDAAAHPPSIGRLSVGCAMWANRAWVQRWYPAETRPGRELTAYATWCDAVEGNTTFYATPTAAIAQGWADQVPAGFRFVNKLPRHITHERRLRDCADELRDFLEVTAPLADVSGPLAVQLPASFEPADLDVLLAFLERCPADHAWAVEVRHPGFFGGTDDERRLNDGLHQRGADRIVMDTRALFDGPRETPEEHDAFQKKPRLEVRPVATGSQPIVRFIGQRSLVANEPYWRRWLPSVVRWLRDGRSPIVFLHTPDNLDALGMAREFHEAVRAELPVLTPLPTPLTPDHQAQLFDDA